MESRSKIECRVISLEGSKYCAFGIALFDFSGVVKKIIEKGSRQNKKKLDAAKKTLYRSYHSKSKVFLLFVSYITEIGEPKFAAAP